MDVPSSLCPVIACNVVGLSGMCGVRDGVFNIVATRCWCRRFQQLLEVLKSIHKILRILL